MRPCALGGGLRWGLLEAQAEKVQAARARTANSKKVRVLFIYSLTHQHVVSSDFQAFFAPSRNRLDLPTFEPLFFTGERI